MREMEEADRDVKEEIERERSIYEGVCIRIEEEKNQFLADLTEEFEDEKREKEFELSDVEGEIRRLEDTIQRLKEVFTELKSGTSIQIKAVQDRTLQEEHEEMIRLDREA